MLAATVADRVTQLSIAGMRCIDEITLDLGPLTVLIGENGSGKSTIGGPALVSRSGYGSGCR
jgi:predicted ATPase